MSSRFEDKLEPRGPGYLRTARKLKAGGVLQAGRAGIAMTLLSKGISSNPFVLMLRLVESALTEPLLRYVTQSSFSEDVAKLKRFPKLREKLVSTRAAMDKADAAIEKIRQDPASRSASSRLHGAIDLKKAVDRFDEYSNELAEIHGAADRTHKALEKLLGRLADLQRQRDQYKKSTVDALRATYRSI